MEQQAEVQVIDPLQRRRQDGSEVRTLRISPEPKKPQAKNKSAVTPLRIGAGVLLALIGVVGWWLYSQQFEDTDDAGGPRKKYS